MKTMTFLGLIYSIIYVISFNKVEDGATSGFYFGSAFNIDLFIPISEDSAFAEWFYVEVSPRESFCDTLVRKDKNSLEWQGRSSSIYKKRNQLIFETKRPYAESKNMVIKLQKDKNHFKEKLYETYKNRLVMNKGFSSYLDSSKQKFKGNEMQQLWSQLSKNHKMDEKVKTLSSREFLIEYEKFKKDLEERFKML